MITVPHKIAYYGSVTVLYLLTLSIIGILFYSSQLFGQVAEAAPSVITQKSPSRPVPTAMTSGVPIRIIIPSRSIDLPVDIGRYDSGSQSWTLSDDRAFFAEISAPANNKSGITFVYGHGTDAVFGRLSNSQLHVGDATAIIHTDSGHVFTYVLDSIKSLRPNETDLFNSTDTGQPRLIVQTCTGAFSEWRTMYTFALKESP